MSSDQVLLEVRDLQVDFEPGRSAVESVSFVLHRSESLGVVGESGSGKTSMARAVLQLLRPTAGTVTLDGEELTAEWTKRFGRWTWNEVLRNARKKMQIVFQDPIASLNPRWTIEDCIAEPLRAFGTQTKLECIDRVHVLLQLVGLPENLTERFPHQLSGGQAQRVAIARALALKPKLLVADEPVSSLDVSVQNGILNLLKHLQSEMDLSLLYISHDLATVKYMCDRIAVMKQGRIVEIGETQSVLAAPEHEYTRALIAAGPSTL